MKPFINPKIRIVLLTDSDIIATSVVNGTNIGGEPIDGTQGGYDARERRNPIWDDYE